MRPRVRTARRRARPLRYRKELVAPNFLRDAVIAEIERTVAAHE